jgi:predicted thioesterase
LVVDGRYRDGGRIAVKSGFEPGIVREITALVTPEMCPAFDGIIVHRCYSTWSLVHHMEIAARKVLVDFLEDHEEGIGSHVSVDHLAPCRVGKTVRVRAELAEITPGHHPRVVCDVTAYDGDRLLAKGTQVQVVMNKEHLARYLEKNA